MLKSQIDEEVVEVQPTEERKEPDQPTKDGNADEGTKDSKTDEATKEVNDEVKAEQVKEHTSDKVQSKEEANEIHVKTETVSKIPPVVTHHEGQIDESSSPEGQIVEISSPEGEIVVVVDKDGRTGIIDPPEDKLKNSHHEVIINTDDLIEEVGVVETEQQNVEEPKEEEKEIERVDETYMVSNEDGEKIDLDEFLGVRN